MPNPSGVDAMITALGGDAHVLGYYERRQNWSASAISDVRSGGTGPALSPTGTPTVDGSNNLVCASGQDMHTANAAIYDQSNAGSLLLVAAIDDNASGTNIGYTPSGGSRGIDLGGNGAGFIGLFLETGVATTVATSPTTFRAIVITWTAPVGGVGGDQTVTIQIDGGTIVSHTVTGGLVDGAAALTFGDYYPGSGNANGGIKVAACVIPDHVVNSTEAAAWVTYKTNLLAGTFPSGFTTSQSGSITPSGAVHQKVERKLAGSVTPSGALSNSTVSGLATKSLAGSVTPSGILSVAAGINSVVGSSSPSGTVSFAVIGGIVQDSRAGSITPAGVLHLLAKHKVTGSIAGSGAVATHLPTLNTKSVAGSISPTGAIRNVLLPPATGEGHGWIHHRWHRR